MSLKTTEQYSDVGQLVREMESNFINSGDTLTSKYVSSNLYEDISKVYAYLGSKHITGATDNQGRDKPFFNIVTAARNVWYRATDIDRRNISISASKISHIVLSYLATVHLQKWMRDENFGSFLNKWGMDLAAFNECIVKFIESEGKLHPMVIPWSRIICDQIDFANNPKIELLELTEAQLRQRKGYDKEIVDKLVEALSTRELTDQQKQDQKSNYIKLYEVHGNLPLSYLTGKEEDQEEYVQQMHVITYVASKEKGKFDDFTLYSGREEQDPYMLTCLLPETDGSIGLNGSVKQLFESQWMMNHTVKAIKDHLDLASKLVFQTADANFVGRNVLTAIETGDILIHAVNMPLTQVNNSSHDIVQEQNFGNMWKSLGNEIAGVSESMLGNTAPSGTAWRQVQALLQESHSLFELMTENKALHLEEMLRRFVIPFQKKQMDTTEEIGATLDAHNLTKIDAMYVPKKAIKNFNRKTIDQMSQLIDDPNMMDQIQPFDQQTEEGKVKEELAPMGGQRFFKPSDTENKTWKSLLKDLEWDLEIDIAGEAKDINNVMQTLNTALVTVMNPGYAANPQAQMIVGKILSQTNVLSPLELSSTLPPKPQMPVDMGNSGLLPVTK